jgi:uncharacterized membrane protein
MKITDTIMINATLERVFGVFTDIEKAPERIKAITKIEVLEGPSKLQLGTKWRETRTMFGKEASETMWVTEMRPSAGYAVEAESHGTKYRSEYTFAENENGVEVTFSFEGLPQTMGARIMGLAFGLFKSATQKALHQDLLDLKAAAESGK